MKNIDTIGKMINQAKILEENNISNMEYANSLSILSNTNGFSKVKGEDLSQMIKELNQHIEDSNRVTSTLLNNLLSKYN